MGVVNRLLELDDRYTLISWLFLKLLALIYLAAFLSLAVQITGLVGPNGILPFQELLDYLYQQQGSWVWFNMPTLFWLGSGDAVLQGATIVGCLISLLLFFGVWPRASLILLFLLYLSLTRAGQVFLNFQWDYLLLETGFLAIFITYGPSRLIILMFHWLLFRLRFLSGLSKLLSDDPSWSGLTTLNYYFETQPLPHIGSWYAHQLPQWLLQSGTGIVLFAELIVPFFIFLPRPFRISAAVITLVIQLCIVATSNHNFVNLLTILLCLFLIDDRVIRRFFPQNFLQPIGVGRVMGTMKKTLLVTVVSAVFVISLLRMFTMVTGEQLPPALNRLERVGHSYGLGNVYHIFPTMQTERQELVIEGSHDGAVWKPYLFRYKPDLLDKTPAIIIPHQPRLDWMIWFVPPRNQEMKIWFDRFMWQLSQNQPQVTGLLKHNPFEESPPRYLRVQVFRYHFTTPEEREQTGNWWKAEYLGAFPQTPPRTP
ncbi:MAG: lipase maturation factor family protein [Gammaproteobacteria bacterium]|nr:lipase maturation factor family protein [Gammaproteobacteria bacterium]